MGKEKMYFVEDNAGARMLVWTNGKITTGFDDNSTEKLYEVKNPQDYLEEISQNSTPEYWTKIEADSLEEILDASKVLAEIEF